jgi:hypothetical protein
VKKIKVYISGPMTGLPGHNFDAFNEAERRLRAAGFDVENPAEKGIVEGWTWEDYLKYDLVRMFECDAVATLPGWQDSRGANLEVYNAVQLELTVDSVEGWLATPYALIHRLAA